MRDVLQFLAKGFALWGTIWLVAFVVQGSPVWLALALLAAAAMVRGHREFCGLAKTPAQLGIDDAMRTG